MSLVFSYTILKDCTIWATATSYNFLKINNVRVCGQSFPQCASKKWLLSKSKICEYDLAKKLFIVFDLNNNNAKRTFNLKNWCKNTLEMGNADFSISNDEKTIAFELKKYVLLFDLESGTLISCLKKDPSCPDYNLAPKFAPDDSFLVLGFRQVILWHFKTCKKVCLPRCRERIHQDFRRTLLPTGDLLYGEHNPRIFDCKTAQKKNILDHLWGRSCDRDLAFSSDCKLLATNQMGTGNILLQHFESGKTLRTPVKGDLGARKLLFSNDNKMLAVQSLCLGTYVVNIKTEERFFVDFRVEPDQQMVFSDKGVALLIADSKGWVTKHDFWSPVGLLLQKYILPCTKSPHVSLQTSLLIFKAILFRFRLTTIVPEAKLFEFVSACKNSTKRQQ